jgi:type II secretory pathway component GspD/PulD (secretin)
MKKYLIALAVLWASIVSAAETSFNFSQIAVAQAVTLIYSEVLKSDYVIDPDVLTDARLVSFRYSKADGQVRPFAILFLKSLGYAVENRSGVDYISKTKSVELLVPDEEVKVYRPRYRDASYLSRILGPLFKGRFTVSKAVTAQINAGVTQNVPSTSAAGQIEQEADVLLFSGSAKEISTLDKLLPQVDISKGEIAVKAVIYEVSSTKAEGSAFQALLNVLSSKVAVTVNTGVSELGSSIKLSVGGFDALLTAVSTDSRFKLLSQPRLRVRSGELAKIVVGQDVPILGAVTYQQGGNAVQSVQYQSAGTILSITPTVHDNTIDMKVSQQLSNFVATTTGVNGSPTLIKRSLDTSITALSGEVIVLGGLTESKTTNTRSGFSFLPWSLAKQDDDQTVDVLVILQLEKV